MQVVIGIPGFFFGGTIPTSWIRPSVDLLPGLMASLPPDSPPLLGSIPISFIPGGLDNLKKSVIDPFLSTKSTYSVYFAKVLFSP